MSLTLKQMENIVNYHDKYPNRKFQSIQKQVCRKFKDMRKIPLYREYIKNGGTKRQQMEKIVELVYERYYEARKKFMPVHSIDLKRWAIDCSKNNSFGFKACDSWIQKFKKRHRIVSRKAVKIVCLKQIESNDLIEKSIDYFRDLFESRKDDYLERYIFNQGFARGWGGYR
jgi:hypothetical protein